MKLWCVLILQQKHAADDDNMPVEMKSKLSWQHLRMWTHPPTIAMMWGLGKLGSSIRAMGLSASRDY